MLADVTAALGFLTGLKFQLLRILLLQQSLGLLHDQMTLIRKATLA